MHGCCVNKVKEVCSGFDEICLKVALKCNILKDQMDGSGVLAHKQVLI